MKLRINGCEIDAYPGQTLLELTDALGLNASRLSVRPLAAKIAGEVFNLNYVPVRVSEFCPDRPSIRRAMEASGGEVQLLYYNDPSGRDVYERTARFVMFLALEKCYPHIKAKMGSTIGKTLMIQLSESVDLHILKDQMQRLIDMDIPLVRRRVSLENAIKH